MSWLLILVIIAAVIMGARIYYSMRKAREAQAADWDAKLVSQLRARGLDPFKPHDVDFFFALPDEQACTAVNQALESQGFRVDVKAVPENGEYPFSLHATRNMHVHAPDMSQYSRQFAQLALTNRGRYDGWSSN